MGTPQNNPTGYHDSSVMTHVPTMSGKLMLVHGLIDENVHFRHTARLINTLIQVRFIFSFFIFLLNDVKVPASTQIIAVRRMLPFGCLLVFLLCSTVLLPFFEFIKRFYCIYHRLASAMSWCCSLANAIPRTNSRTKCTLRTLCMISS